MSAGGRSFPSSPAVGGKRTSARTQPKARACATRRENLIQVSIRGDPAPPKDQRDWLHAAIGLVILCVAAYLLTRLSLDNVAGVTRRRNGDCCDTEFANGEWWMPMFALALPIWWVTRSVPWAAIPATAIATYASFHIADTTVNRYVDSGWGDGLESLAYVGTAVHGLVFGLAALIGVVSWRHRQRRAGAENER